MEWLSQNWIWLAVTGFVLAMMLRRGGTGGCCGSMHSEHHKRPKTGAQADDEAAGEIPRRP